MRGPIDAAVRRALNEFNDPPGPCSVAVSGGLDSTALAHGIVPILLERGCTPTLACFDHGWRPFDAERAAVREFAERLDVPVRFGRRRPDPAVRRSIGPEAEARRARLGWLRRGSEGPIYLGHHRDDQLENVLLHGVAMNSSAGRLRRPLLQIRRHELREAAEGLLWVEDPTNRDLNRPRNRLRHRVTARLWASGEAETHLIGGWTARSRRTYLEDRAQRAMPALLRSTAEDRHVLNRAELSSLPSDVAAIAVRSLCRSPGRGPSRRAIDGVLLAAQEGRRSRVDLGSGWTGVVERSGVELVRERATPTRRALGKGTGVDWPGFGRLSRKRVARPRLDSHDLGRRAALLPTTDAPLWVAAAGSGRRMRPFGLGGSRPVRDLLAEAGISAPRRSSWPVVLDDGDRVLWIPGVRASEHATLPPHSAGATLLLFTDGIDAP